MTRTLHPDEYGRAADAGAQSVTGRPGAARAPFVRVRYANGTGVVEGALAARIGHKAAVPDASLGLYGEWAWDGATLTAEVDPLGYFSLFVYRKGNEIALSTSILQLLALGADAAPDPVALAVFHRIGHFLGEDTPFRHIKVLPPAGRLVWRDGVAVVSGAVPVPQETAMTRAQAVEAFIELPRAAIRRFLSDWNGPIVLPLSGGRDSRHILLELVQQGRKPDAVATFQQSGRHFDREVQAARAVADRAGVRHVILGHPRGRLRDALRAILLTQLCADEHGQMLPMHDFLAGQPGVAALDGIGGDILTNPDDDAADFFALARKGDYTAIAERLAGGHGRIISRDGDPDGAGALYSPDLKDAALDRIATAIRAFDAAPDPYQAFWFWNRTRREIAFVSTGILGPAARVACPFLSPAFVTLGLSLPFAVTRDQRLHDDAIGHAFPAFADIPYESGFQNPRLPRLRWARVANALDRLRVGAMAGLGAIPGRSSLRPGPADIYRMHAGFVSAMDAAEAQRLIALETRLDLAAVKGERVVSDVFPGA